MGNSAEKNCEDQKLSKQIGEFNTVLKVLSEQHFKCQYTAEMYQQPITKGSGFCGRRNAFESRIKLKISKTQLTKSLSQEIIIPSDEFKKLKKLFSDLQQCSTPDGDEIFDEDSNKCELCIDKQLENLLPCGHAFCKSCIQKWFQGKARGTCPKCRQSMDYGVVLTSNYVRVISPPELRQKIRDLISRLSTQDYKS